MQNTCICSARSVTNVSGYSTASPVDQSASFRNGFLSLCCSVMHDRLHYTVLGPRPWPCHGESCEYALVQLVVFRLWGVAAGTSTHSVAPESGLDSHSEWTMIVPIAQSEPEPKQPRDLSCKCLQSLPQVFLVKNPGIWLYNWTSSYSTGSQLINWPGCAALQNIYTYTCMYNGMV